MARINAALIERIGAKLGIGDKAVYARIAKVANDRYLDRHLAALVLAGDLGININKYSTSDERDAARGNANGGGRRGADDAPPRRDPEPRRPATKARAAKRKVKDNTIFVVHGRDEPLRKSMFDFLRTLGLNPKEWDQVLREARGNNPFIGNAIDEVMDRAQAVVVMFTPDDLVQLKPQFVGRDEKNTEGKSLGQARPNVLFEAGLAMARHQEKTVLVQIGRVKPVSDIGGRHIVKLAETPESRNDLANRLEKIGCKVDKVGRDWLKAGVFAPTEPKVTKKKKAAKA